MQYIYFDKKGKSCWSDTDYSMQDKIPYYPAPKGVEVGTQCKIVDEKAVADPIPQNQIEELNKKQKLKYLINNKIHKLNTECDVLIQTVPAKIRTDVIGRLKTKSKQYSSTWQHFYQRCQNLRHDQDIVYQKEARQSASWVVERIEHVSKIKDSIKKEILTMSLEDIEKIDIKKLILSKVDENFKI